MPAPRSAAATPGPRPAGGTKPASSTRIPPTAPGADRPGSSGRPPGGGRPGGRRLVAWIAGGLALVVVLAALFFLGQSLVGGGDPAPVAVGTSSATPTPSATPTEAPPAPVEVTGPQPAGEHAWDTLFGGECLQPYVSPWEEKFTVADCATPHAAQLVYRGVFAGDAATAFPGEAELAGQINALCSAPGVIDPAAAAAYSDLQVQGSYPVTEEQWTDGARYYYCFVSLASGEPLTATVAGPGPAA
ncbi:hypothetical protein E3T49_05040 [Cryobacterium cryoconiti]|uniref:Septum formation-related domain-containing protein n=1 Tax=Cryobacterium cryoconiti TaxID=1259239 RepID=A0A4Y8JX07_9MICO|nr:hypothetical protein E3T49_05040 [Cryobacterium cryoconiti]